MKRGEWAKNLDRIRAEAVDDVIAVQKLVELGVPERTIYRRCQDGTWTLMATTTVRLTSGVPTRRQLLTAALIYAGPDAQVTGLDGARAHQLRRGELPGVVHLLIPAGRRKRSLPTIRIERTTRLLPPRTRDGLPVAPLERCVLDAVRGLESRSDVAAILTEPVQQRMTLVGSLLTELKAGCQRGTALPRAVLRAAERGVRSPAELDLHDWWFADPELANYTILFNVRLTVGSLMVGIADAYLPDVGLVLPVDSVEHHFMTPDQVETTERQHRAYRSAGLHVFGIRPSRLRAAPSALRQDVLAAIAVAEQLPQPLISWTPDLPHSA